MSLRSCTSLFQVWRSSNSHHHHGQWTKPLSTLVITSKPDKEEDNSLASSHLTPRRSYVTSAANSRFYARRRRFQQRQRPPLVPQHHQHQHPINNNSTNVHQQPTMNVAQAMPLSVAEMDNSTLVVLGELGDPGALEEILKRHIMVVDQVDYPTATKTFYQIAAKNSEGMYLLTFPYYAGITIALGAGFASFPLVFDLGTADWFNANFVTTDIPESEDLETALEVGAWTWNWMEPPLGQISFFLLCLQFSRAQMDNVGIKPYTKRIKQMRALHLTELFPQYNADILMNYSKNCSMNYKPPEEAAAVLPKDDSTTQK